MTDEDIVVAVDVITDTTEHLIEEAAKVHGIDEDAMQVRVINELKARLAARLPEFDLLEAAERVRSLAKQWEILEDGVSMSQTEFDSLLEYSSSNPTRLEVGMRWKRKVRYRSKEDGILTQWYLCWVEADPSSSNTTYVYTKSVKIREVVPDR